MKILQTAFVMTALTTALTLTGCGSSAKTGGTETPSSQQSGAPGQIDQSQLNKIQACLKAAGIDVQLPTAMPSGAPSSPPTDLPTDIPSSGPGGGTNLNDPNVSSALKACGITVPSGPPGNGTNAP